MSAAPASAHFLATDKNIGAVLHVDPSDSPVAGEQTSFFFEFKDKDNKFDPQKCDCSFEILENGKTVYLQSLYQNVQNPTLSNAAVFHTFEKIGAYEIKVSGKPNSENAFKTFNLIWNLRVDRNEQNGSVNTRTVKSFFSFHFLHLIIIGLGFVIFILLLKKDSKKSTSKGGDRKD